MKIVIALLAGLFVLVGVLAFVWILQARGPRPVFPDAAGAAVDPARTLVDAARTALTEELEGGSSSRQGSREGNPLDHANDPKVVETTAGDFVTLARVSDRDVVTPSDEEELRRRCRELVEAAGGGLIEASVVSREHGPAIEFIYKRLHGTGFTYTGVLIVPTAETAIRWAVTSSEKGMTGVREVFVTTELMNAGELDLETYESSWAQDPYDPDYAGVDRSTLRYMSDDAKYDAVMPGHPLSVVRRVLRGLLDADYGSRD